MARVLIVDDEAKLGRLAAEALELDGHAVTRVGGGRAALVELAAKTFDVVVTDLRMPEVDGLRVLSEARSLADPPEVVMITAHGTAETAVAAMKGGAADYLLKPFSLDELRLRVRRLADQRAAESARGSLLGRLTPALVAESPKMKEALAAATRVARTDASVLLLGESGTGKSQFARYVHFTSKRSGKPLVEVHCAALPESLLESELFGHLPGAFTGATARRLGHLARADGGTLFLDEIGEVTPATQVKLLRFLQEREFVPLGATDAQRVDVRVIAATNRNLSVAVKEGAFREDFYYRLNVFTIVVPPLRERPEDVLPLVDRFLAARGLPPEKVTRAARDRLVAHGWPGNVRELENALERALILAGEDPAGPDLFGLGAPARALGDAASLLVDGFNLDTFEADLVRAALERSGGNRSAAARLLGITRRRLYSRLRSLESREGEAESADEEDET